MDFQEQYCIGTQGFEKQVFWALGMETCPRCRTKSVEGESDCCVVRHNGATCGVSIFTCPKCDFKTSFQYDEAADRYYYETSFWNYDDIINEWKKITIQS